MARIRTIKPEFWRSPATASASPLARLLYIAMWNWADDYGVAEWTPRELLGFAFPNDEHITTSEFQRLCKEVACSFQTDFYIVGGRRYYRIPSWDDHQKTERRANARNPLPDGPESTPDQAIVGVTENRGTSSALLGKTPAGTGEQGNRGTGEEVLMSTDGERESSPKSPYSAAFEEWWSHYPKKESKGDAWKAWEATRKARTMPDLAALIAATNAYTRKTKGGDQQFVKLPAGWLRDRKWEDEPAPAESAGWGHLRRLGGAA